MDKCSTELISLFIERACASDCGETARTIGLVSKYFRSIAEPLEFRALVVSGLDKLKATLVRLEKARATLSLKNGPDGTNEVGVQHLFISEYKSEHAAAMRLSIADRIDYSQYTPPDAAETFGIADHYNARQMKFWESVTPLVRSVSTTLITLTVLQQSSAFNLGRHALGFLSGVHLTRLKVLTLKQRSTGGGSTNCNDPEFVPPTAPLLRILLINALTCVTSYGQPVCSYIHPILVDAHSRFGALTQLCILDPFLRHLEVKTIICVLCGTHSSSSKSALECTRNRRLPGKLVSVTFHQACSEDDEWIRVYAAEIKAFGIDGLETNIQTRYYTEEKVWGYKVLLDEWKEQALEK